VTAGLVAVAFMERLRVDLLGYLFGDILAVPQFTLYGKSHKGRRPDFTDAMDPAVASPAFDAFRTALESALGKTVPAGVFGAEMQVTLVNDGPLTLQFEF